MHSQSHETGTLDVLKIKIFFATQPRWADFNLFKILYVDFTQWWWYILLHCAGGISYYTVVVVYLMFLQKSFLNF